MRDKLHEVKEGKDLATITTPATAFKAREHYGKCRKHVEEALSNSPRKRKKLIANLANREGFNFRKPGKKVSRNKLSDDVKAEVLNFYEDDIISY
mgnify:CR=1 FL=1